MQVPLFLRHYPKRSKVYSKCWVCPNAGVKFLKPNINIIYTIKKLQRGKNTPPFFFVC